MYVLELFRDRRSVRQFKETPVEEDKLNAVLEAARWAPSWANTQCWRFIVVRSTDRKKLLAETLPPGNPARAGMRGPIVVAICAELEKSGYSKRAPATDKGDWYMFDSALATENLVLAAHALELGTVIVGRFDSKKAEEILGVPEGYRIVCLIPLGYPKETPSKGPSRRELSELVFQESFGAK